MEEIGLGGGCHWCTEAVFQSLRGVDKVAQGWISALEKPTFSEAVIVRYDDAKITLRTLIQIHLHTHSCTSGHVMREKYRSAVYAFAEEQKAMADAIIKDLQKDFEAPLITKAYLFSAFKLNTPHYQGYYFKNPDKPFCQTRIAPKLRLLLNTFKASVDPEKLC